MLIYLRTLYHGKFHKSKSIENSKMNLQIPIGHELTRFQLIANLTSFPIYLFRLDYFEVIPDTRRFHV
jgi:hypothetical protein